MANSNGGEVLMLEAAPSSRPSWSTGGDVIDALPYIDDEYDKEEVDGMIQKEMRMSSKKPSDFLKQLPPIPSFNLEVLFFFYLFLAFSLLIEVLELHYCDFYVLGFSLWAFRLISVNF